MSNRYMRIVYDFEVEITDPVTAAAATMHIYDDVNDKGDLTNMTRLDPEKAVERIVSQIFFDAARERGPQCGFAITSGGSPFIRTRDEAGDYVPFTYPAEAGREDDGTLHDWPK